MRKENFQSPADKEMNALALDYELSMKSGKPAYMDSDTLADLADWYAFNGEYDKAMDVCQYGLRLHPNNSSLLIELAYVYLDEEDVDKAEQITNSVPEQDMVEVTILRAHILAERGDERGMRRLLEGIENFDDMQNAVEAAYLYSDVGRPALGIKLLEGLKAEYGEEEPYLACLSDCYMAAHRYREAIEGYNSLIDIDPYSPRYWTALASAHFYKGEYNKAIEACDFALVTDEEYAEAHRIRGYAFYSLGNEEEALKSYQLARKCAATDNDDVEEVCDVPLDCMAALQKVEAGDWDAGLEDLDKIIEKTPEGSPVLPLLYANAALCLYEMGKQRKAYEYCRKAKQVAPKNKEGYLMEGNLLLKDGEIDKAIRQWEVAMKQDPDVDAWIEIADNCLEATEVTYALRAYEAALDIDPEYAQLNNELFERLTFISILLEDKERLLKYNALSDNPIDLTDLSHPTGFISKLPEEDDVRMLMQNIRNMLKSKS